jgi:hypothetical protein
MTVDSPPAADRIESILTLLEDERLDDADWIDAEFTAIIAANWDTEPPEPSGPPAGLPARWNPPRRAHSRGSAHRLGNRVMAHDHQRRQRSPPNK